MNKAYIAVRAAFLVALPMMAVAPMNAETLRYTINWQSGLSLGEASLQTSKGGSLPEPPPKAAEAPEKASEKASTQASAAAPEAAPPADPKKPETPEAPKKISEGGWVSRLTLDAAVPGFVIRDEYKAQADSKFCSEELVRTVKRGVAESSETSTFDQETKKITRETKNGGRSVMETTECARDALTFVQFMREELAQGRLVPHQSVYLGSKYDLQITYIGNDVVKLGDRRIDADQIRVNSHGPKSDFEVFIYFAKDDNRTPLMARLTLTLGTFTVELTR